MVSEKDVIEAFNKGKRSGSASARAKTTKSKKRRRVFRIKKPTVVLKQAIGKFQHKHPVLSTGGTVLIVLPVVDRVLAVTTNQSLSQATGMNFTKLPGFLPIRGFVGAILNKARDVLR